MFRMLYMLRSYYTWFLFKRFQQRVGQWEMLQTQGRREEMSELDEVSDYSTSSGTEKNYWMPFGSVLFMELHIWNTSLPCFRSLCLPLVLCVSPFLSPSPLIGDAIKVCGVSGSSRWGRMCVSLQCAPADTCASQRSSICCSNLPFSRLAHKNHRPETIVCTSNNCSPSAISFFFKKYMAVWVCNSMLPAVLSQSCSMSLCQPVKPEGTLWVNQRASSANITGGRCPAKGAKALKRAGNGRWEGGVKFGVWIWK